MTVNLQDLHGDEENKTQFTTEDTLRAVKESIHDSIMRAVRL